MNNDKISIKAWAEEDRPREKLLHKGRHVLTDAELIAILIGAGNTTESAVELSKRILHELNGSLERLAKLTVPDLIRFNGIGEAKAISIIAAMELGRRRKDAAKTESDKVNSSLDAFRIMQQVFIDLPHEEFWVLLLNRSNKVIGKQVISKGGVTGTIADPKLIFKAALEQLAPSIILLHNHPSGNLKPSEADIALTKRIKQSGILLEIAVIDHLIITNSAYFSFADEGMM